MIEYQQQSTETTTSNNLGVTCRHTSVPILNKDYVSQISEETEKNSPRRLAGLKVGF